MYIIKNNGVGNSNCVHYNIGSKVFSSLVSRELSHFRRQLRVNCSPPPNSPSRFALPKPAALRSPPPEAAEAALSIARRVVARHARTALGEPQATEVLENFRQLCLQISPKPTHRPFGKFGPFLDIEVTEQLEAIASCHPKPSQK